MAVGIQLRGMQQVMDAYDNLEVKIWAIYSYKNLLIKGEGAAELKSFLDLICRNATEAPYTLKVYEDLTDPKQVKEKTEASGSLNFKLGADDFEAIGSPVYTGRQSTAEMFNQIRELKEEIKQLREGSGQPETVQEAVIGLLQNPGEAAQLIMAFKEVVSSLFSNNNAPAAAPVVRAYQDAPRPAAVGNIQQTPMSNTPRDLTDTEKEKIAAAVDTLIEKDPKIADHMEKLAAIAERNPTQFQLLLITLDNMRI